MKTLFTTFFFLSLSFIAASQCKFNWRSTTQQYPDGTTTGHTYNNAYSSINVAIGAMTVGSNLAWQTNNPRVPSSGPDRLTLGVNYGAGATPANSFVTTSITFSTPVCGLNFKLYEIDKGGATAAEPGKFDYVDEVVVSAVDNGGTGIATPTITPSAYASVAGNVITGTSSDPTTPGGAATSIAYPSGTCVKTLTITYRSTTDARNNPSMQLVAIGCMDWTSPLPVTLASFYSQMTPNTIKLHWQTSVETNSERFEVQKSMDALGFETIGHINAATTSDQLRSYEFEDKSPVEGWNYYRLKVLDLDQSYEYSKIIAHLFEQNQTYFDVMRSTSDGNILVKTNGKEPVFQIFDGLGRNILNGSAITGSNQYLLSLSPNSTLAIIKVMMANGEVFTRKIVLF